MDSEARCSPLARRHRTAVPLAIVLVAAIRFYGLGAKSLWLDETVSARLAVRGPAFILQTTISKDAHPPFYYLALWAWSSVFGTSEAGLRSFSAACGVAAVVVFYFFTRKLTGERIALLSSAVFALSGYGIFYSQEARQYSLVTLLVMSTNLCILKAIRDEARFRTWVAYALLTIASLYTFYYTLFACVAQGVALLVCGRRRLQFAWWLAAATVGACAFLAWVPVVLDRMSTLRALAPPGRGRVTTWDLTAAFLQYATGYWQEVVRCLWPRSWLPDIAWTCAAISIALVPLAVAILGSRTDRERSGFLLLLLGVPLAIAALFPVKYHAFNSKHLAYLSPCYFALLAGSLALPRFRAFAVAALPFLVALNLASGGLYLFAPVEKENWRGACRLIESGSRAGAAVIANPAWAEFPLNYYLHGAIPVIQSPIAGKPKNFEQLARRYPVVWLVQCYSEVSVPNPDVAPAFLGSSYLPRDNWTYEGLFGTITVTLYEETLYERPQGDDAR